MDHPPRVFSLGTPAVCQQPFTHDGVEFKPGDTFPYEQLGLLEYQVRGLWASSLIGFVAESAVTPPKAKLSKRRAGSESPPAA